MNNQAKKPDYSKPPYADKDGNPTPQNPHYAAWKAKRDIKTQDSINGAPKQVAMGVRG